MRFRVERVSTYFHQEVAPCPEAVEGSVPRRDVRRDEPAWFLDLDSLEALMAFHDRHGDIVIHHDGRYEDPCIEIYDGYRE